MADIFRGEEGPPYFILRKSATVTDLPELTPANFSPLAAKAKFSEITKGKFFVFSEITKGKIFCLSRNFGLSTWKAREIGKGRGRAIPGKSVTVADIFRVKKAPLTSF